MERLKLAEVRSLSEFLRGLYAARDLDGFVDYALSALPGVVSSELTAYGNLNPTKGIFNIIAKPSNIVTPKLIRTFDAHAQEHPFSQDYMGGGDGHAKRISDLLPRSQFQRLALYNEFFRAIKIDSEMVIWLPAPRPREITFAVHRSRGDFSERDRLLFDLLRPHLSQAHENAEAVSLLRQGVEVDGQEVLLLTQDSRIQHATARAHHLLKEYFKLPVHTPGCLPESLAGWVQHYRELLNTLDNYPPPPDPLVLDRHGRSLTVRLLSGPTQCLLLLDERPTSRSPASLESLGLTRREAEVLAWVAQGKTNDAIATLLGLSYRTIEKHLESILRKLGVETRTGAALRALETAGVNGVLVERP